MRSDRPIFMRMVIGVLAAVLICGGPARAPAQNLDPFETDTNQWKSFDRYKEEEKNRLFSTMTGNIEEDSRAEAKAVAEEEKSEAVPIKKPASDADKDTIMPPSLDSSVMAAPEKPLDPPVMPGVNNGLDMHAGSTDDDAKPSAHVVNLDSEPNLQLPKQNWLDALRAAQLNGREDHTPLHIRMSFLPGFEAPQKHNTPKAVVASVLPPPIKKEVQPKSPADVAACAAIDAYKKRQLEAIQSDRETLAALQSAIKQLGLEKKLDFLSEAGSLSTTADKSALMDMPVTPPPALPPVGKP